jgi:hypothetical protein
MLVGCRNCGSYFTEDEIRKRKPPMHSWKLTPQGEQAQSDNVERGENTPCPKCGQNSLGVAKTPAA